MQAHLALDEAERHDAHCTPMGDDPKSKSQIEPPRGGAVPVIYPAGTKRPAGLAPPELGPTVKVAIRANAETVELINEHVDRLAKSSPGFVITVSDAVRSLIAYGAAALREADKRKADLEDR